MVSFRNSQFQASLQGMVIADAISHGQLPWRLAGMPTVTLTQAQLTAIKIPDADWCRAIAAQLQQLSARPNEPLWPVSVPPIDKTASLAALLSSLPQLLCQLDSLPYPAPLSADAARAPDRSGIAAFTTCLRACLRQDVAALASVEQYLADVSEPVAQGLTQALAIVLAAQGDFQLAVGQSLYWSAAIEGLPVLTGILSAGWGGLLSLPCGYQQCLQQSHPACQAWLQERWQISHGAQLDRWAGGLWQHWLGYSPWSQPIAITGAVLPA